MTTLTHTPEARAAFHGCREYLRIEIKTQSATLRPAKIACRKGETCQSSVRSQRNHVRALYLLYGLIRSKPWPVIEKGHDEPVPATRSYLVHEWNRMLKAGHTIEAPACIASWLA